MPPLRPAAAALAAVPWRCWAAAAVAVREALVATMAALSMCPAAEGALAEPAAAWSSAAVQAAQAAAP